MIGEVLYNIGWGLVQVLGMFMGFFIVFVAMTFLGVYVVGPLAKRTPRTIRRIGNWLGYALVVVFALFILYQIGKG